METTPDLNGQIVIIGGGQGGAETAAQLRQNGHAGEIVILADEAHLPYLRPPLSKDYLAGAVSEEALLYKSAKAYADAAITLRTGAGAVRIDRANRRVILADGETLDFDRLVLATGGRARPMEVPGAQLKNIFYLRTRDDVEQIRPHLVAGRRIAIIGGGYVGLETAAVAAKRGLDVSLLVRAPRVLNRVASPEMSAFYEGRHRAAGVHIHTNVTVRGFSAGQGDAIGAVELGAHGRIKADLVVIGIGLVPNTGLAEAAGLAVDDGIVVNEHAQSSDPSIYAIGDCAMHAHHPFLQRPIRIESVPNTLEQARIAAAAICGRPVPAATPPWFWSDQYELRLQMVGLAQGHDELVVRGEPSAAGFMMFYLKGGIVIAADAVNRPGEFMVAKRLVAARKAVAPTRLADVQQPLKELR
jgi:3-phenylpropionate/trans-cinnamate dioxygenase ferredoxin reductase subunit